MPLRLPVCSVALGKTGKASANSRRENPREADEAPVGAVVPPGAARGTGPEGRFAPYYPLRSRAARSGVAEGGEGSSGRTPRGASPPADSVIPAPADRLATGFP
ncbi:hypothetical protein GCM10017688_40310 [Streptomyces ramulosus]